MGNEALVLRGLRPPNPRYVTNLAKAYRGLGLNGKEKRISITIFLRQFEEMVSGLPRESPEP